jgi:3'-phosphoadenosine 5'-phosphosulfate sulfotransferase (PAPS reductase)/FAD synthetase
MLAQGLVIFQDGSIQEVAFSTETPGEAHQRYSEIRQRFAKPVLSWQGLHFTQDDGTEFPGMFLWNDTWVDQDPHHKKDLSLAKCHLRQRSALSFRCLLRLTEMRIKTAYQEFDGMIYASFSGGLDSQVLLHITRRLFPEVPAVFCNSGVEWPENLTVVRQTENVTWIQPKKRFPQIIRQYGYPIISKDVAQKVHELQRSPSETLRQIRLHGDASGNGKLAQKWQYLVNAPFPISHKCCDVLKKQPAQRYEKQSGRIPLLGELTEESRNRETEYLSRGGCNMFAGKRPKSIPLAFWSKAAIWAYANEHGLHYSRLYDLGWTQTGCFPCGFGCHLERADLFTENRWQRMKRIRPKLYTYCMEKLGLDDVLSYLHVHH